ncbi:MAG: DNA double-strand break repair nuclease NurA [Bacteroidales bacterium]|nr:DNA double-strand break repair nuclease NurA [Bacteroidales bacterium]
MPYQNEFADKTSHIDIVKNPDVVDFLERYHRINECQEEDIIASKSLFSTPEDNNFHKPDNIISIDGSFYEASRKKEFPSQKIGFIKFGVVLLQYKSLAQLSNSSKFVDPFEVAKFKENNEAYTFVLPSTNIVIDDCDDVQESFRAALEEQFDKLRDREDDPNTSLKSTLFKMASYLDGCDKNKIRVKCPYCSRKNKENNESENKDFYTYIYKDDNSPKCKCGKRLYVTDILRIWEQVSDATSNQSALSRTMNIVERLLAIHYIRSIVESLKDSYANTLENLCFFIDGPLAVFGEPAKFHACFMKYLHELNQTMRRLNKSDILMVGIQKSGAINDYLNLIKDHINKGEVYCLTDEVRNKYVSFTKNAASDFFGKETYFGQDFLYKNKKGNVFVFNVPYPFEEKSKVQDFKKEKSNIANYKNIKVYTDLLDDFDCALYENALIPTVLAHKYTAISMAPGSKVLDLLSKNKIV